MKTKMLLAAVLLTAMSGAWAGLTIEDYVKARDGNNPAMARLNSAFLLGV